eukprot:TRINITY_DN92423_c0_g1_i1.p1 TRINITY_DN92423_c0_g1~~TRINITY_DN92423_c0_g1_i1.p1  ORF type:complete len:305 (-),score=79.04 TRINITY_DN92423_c0_g1_i1:48-962(-)
MAWLLENGSSLDESLRAEIESVDGLINNLLLAPNADEQCASLPGSSGGAALPSSAPGARGYREQEFLFQQQLQSQQEAHQRAIGQRQQQEEPLSLSHNHSTHHTPQHQQRSQKSLLEHQQQISQLQQTRRAPTPHAASTACGASLAEQALRAECAALEASFEEARKEVERLTRRRCSLERALASARDEVGRLRASQVALQAECDGWQQREELARRHAAEAVAAAEARADTQRAEAQKARHELRTCREELSALRHQLPWPGRRGGPGASTATEDADVEAEVLELCRKLQREATATQLPRSSLPPK